MERSICGTVWPPRRLAQVDRDGLSTFAVYTTQQAPISPVVSTVGCYPGLWGGGYGGVDTEQVGFPVYLEGGTLISSQGSPARPGAKT